MLAGIYVHVPFCRSKCRYCGFVSYPYQKEPAHCYLEALFREMALTTGKTAASFGSVFIGGGTPTCLDRDDLLGLLRHALAFPVVPGAEVTVEANPGTVDAPYLQALRAAGVNRLSLGAQTFEDRLLRLLGRPVGPEVVRQTVADARAAGFANVSIDVIFGLPGQTPASFRQTLDAVLALEPEHVSAYGLELIPGTPLGVAVEEGTLAPCPEDDALEMYEDAIHTLTDEGYHHYEISNFARSGYECRHNLLYWENGDYLGFGPAAASHWQGRRWTNADKLADYCGGEGVVFEAADQVREMTDTALMGLRLLAGLDLAGFSLRFGVSLESVYGKELERVKGQGLVEIAGGRLRLTKRGLPLANEVFLAFV